MRHDKNRDGKRKRKGFHPPGGHSLVAEINNKYLQHVVCTVIET